jgi:cytochrome P450
METLASSVDRFKTDIFEETRPAAVACPFGYYSALREEHPVAHIRHGDDDIYVLTRMEDITQVLRKSMLFSNHRAGGPKAASIRQAVAEAIEAYPEVADLIAKLGEPAAPVLDLADAPAHTRQRAIVGDRFMPQQVGCYEPMLRDYVISLLDSFPANGKVELVEGFSVKLPLRVITEILGIPEDMRATFRRWTDDQVSVIGNPTLTVEDGKRIAETNVAFHEYFTDLIDERRAHPGTDLISEIVQRNELLEEKLAHDELIGIFHQLAGAGHETTRNLISSCLLRLTEDPALFTTLKANPDDIPRFIEEVLRLEAPSVGLFRSVLEDTEVGGVPIAAGSLVWLIYAAGNRDPAVYPDPDKLDYTRKNLRQHIAFGQGRHACIGAALSRMETRVAITEVVERFSGIALAEGFVPDYGRSYILRGIGQLEVVFQNA